MPRKFKAKSLKTRRARLRSKGRSIRGGRKIANQPGYSLVERTITRKDGSTIKGRRWIKDEQVRGTDKVLKKSAGEKVAPKKTEQPKKKFKNIREKLEYEAAQQKARIEKHGRRPAQEVYEKEGISALFNEYPPNEFDVSISGNKVTATPKAASKAAPKPVAKTSFPKGKAISRNKSHNYDKGVIKDMEDFQSGYLNEYRESYINDSKKLFSQMGYDFAKGRQVPGLPGPSKNVPPLVKDVIANKSKFKSNADYKRAILSAYQGNGSGYLQNVDAFESALKLPGGYTKHAADKRFSSIIDKAADKDGYITLYRGLSKKPKAPTGTSWTVDKKVATEFASYGDGYIMETRVKRSEIFELGAYTGFKTELEIFVPATAKRSSWSYYKAED